MIKKNYRIDQLNKQELWKDFGKNQTEIDPNLDNTMDQVIEEALSVVSPKAILKSGNLEDFVLLGVPLKGDGIQSFLEGSSEAALLALTIGQEIERRIRKYERTDMLKALLMDTVASHITELTADKLTKDFREEVEARNLFITERFSPGYSDFPLATQSQILSALDAPRQIGLSVSDSSILIPRKSITAVIGVRETPRKPRGKRCEYCNLRGKCLYGICARE